MQKSYTVVVVLEAKPGKQDELKSALKAVIEPSRNESTNLEYRLHQDLNNPAQFVLYENWISKEAHQLQFQKPYIAELGDKLGALMAGSYQAIFAEPVDL
jgi:quinol monooxygenase YgiN